MATESLGAGPRPTVGGRGLGLFVAVAAAVPLLYAALTGHVWEDYFITFRHSQNLCEGHGLVYRPGEIVHGFTSPLGTLLPAACYLVTGKGPYAPALWLFRVLSAFAFAGGGLCFLLALRAAGSGRAGLLTFALLYLLDAKSVAFAANGMESGFLLLFLGGAVLAWARGADRHWRALGLCWAGLMWTRPDACVYIAALGLADLTFGGAPRRPRLVAAVRSAAVCAALYLPWLLAAWAYYGSPVPNTIRAKSAYGAGYRSLAETVAATALHVPERLKGVFGPIYFYFGGWPGWLAPLTVALGAVCATYWLLPARDRLGRAASLAFALAVLYLSVLEAGSPWYYPPATALGLLVLARLCDAVAARIAGAGRLSAVALAPALLLVTFQGWLLAATAREMAVQQAGVETGNRARIGLWLKDHVKGEDRVYLECLGYIGYFSDGVHMLDYPGLASPDVVREARGEPHDMTSVGLRLGPEWMVLRPSEAAAFRRHPEFVEGYAWVKRFDVSDEINGRGDVLGKGYLLADATFDVFRRRVPVPPEDAYAGR
jgi:hypothetical protein